MHNYGQDLNFDIVLPRMKIMNQKQAIQALSKHAAAALDISTLRLQKMLIEKENRSSSGIGNGLAIPHLQATGPKKNLTILATLERSVEWNSIDNKSVDLVCLVLSPDNTGPYHLRRLSRISRLLKHDGLHKKLTEAKDERAMRALLIDPEDWLMAA